MKLNEDGTVEFEGVDEQEVASDALALRQYLAEREAIERKPLPHEPKVRKPLFDRRERPPSGRLV